MQGASRRLPQGIWVLGLGSLFMDTSSEMVHSLLPIFMASVLGASMVTIGVVEGVAEATAAVTKLFSGAISDYFRARKLLIVIGYGLAAITKPVFPLANSITWVFAARFVDRIGKGIRGAPRDALVADLTPADLRGAAYGLRQALDSVGAFIGPLLAVVFMISFDNDIKVVLWVAVVPAFIAVTLFIFGVHEPGAMPADAEPGELLTFAGALQLPVHYWLVVALGGIFTLARFSQAFLVLRAHNIGLAVSYIPMVLIVMNVIYAAAAYPAGIAADHLSRRVLLIAGLVPLVVADVLLAVAGNSAQVLIGAAFWGLHLGLTEGLLSKLVADFAAAPLRATAFGIFNFVTGVTLLLSSVLAGVLWSAFGAAATFMAGAIFAGVTIGGLFFVGHGRLVE